VISSATKDVRHVPRQHQTCVQHVQQTPIALQQLLLQVNVKLITGSDGLPRLRHLLTVLDSVVSVKMEYVILVLKAQRRMTVDFVTVTQDIHQKKIAGVRNQKQVPTAH